MNENLQILSVCPLFAGIADADITRMLACLGAQSAGYPRHATVLAEGDPVSAIGILLSGALQVVRNDHDGNRSILGNLTPGELFAEVFACSEVDALPLSVIATADSRVMFINAAHLLRTCDSACSSHQRLIYNLMKDLATKNLAIHQKIDVISRRTTRDKLMTYLYQQSRLHRAASFTVPFDRQALADYLEVDRSGLSAEIGRLRREGVLACVKNHFTLL